MRGGGGSEGAAIAAVEQLSLAAVSHGGPCAAKAANSPPTEAAADAPRRQVRCAQGVCRCDPRCSCLHCLLVALAMVAVQQRRAGRSGPQALDAVCPTSQKGTPLCSCPHTPDPGLVAAPEDRPAAARCPKALGAATALRAAAWQEFQVPFLLRRGLHQVASPAGQGVRRMRSGYLSTPTPHPYDKRRTLPATYGFMSCNNAINIKVWYIIVVIPGHRLPQKKGASMPPLTATYCASLSLGFSHVL